MCVVEPPASAPTVSDGGAVAGGKSDFLCIQVPTWFGYPTALHSLAAALLHRDRGRRAETPRSYQRYLTPARMPRGLWRNNVEPKPVVSFSK
jgi:hypothetical protein